MLVDLRMLDCKRSRPVRLLRMHPCPPPCPNWLASFLCESSYLLHFSTIFIAYFRSRIVFWCRITTPSQFTQFSSCDAASIFLMPELQRMRLWRKRQAPDAYPPLMQCQYCNESAWLSQNGWRTKHTSNLECRQTSWSSTFNETRPHRSRQIMSFSHKSKLLRQRKLGKSPKYMASNASNLPTLLRVSKSISLCSGTKKMWLVTFSAHYIVA